MAKAKNIMFSMTGSIQNSMFAFFELDNKELDNIKNENWNTSLVNKPIILEHRKGIGTISNYMNESEYKKAIDTNKNSPRSGNPVEGDAAFLSPNKNILAIKGSIKFINNFSKPSLSDSKELRIALKTLTEKYKEKFGYEYLIKRYLQNLVSGRAFWRNSFGFNKFLVVDLKTSLGYSEKFVLNGSLANVDVTQPVYSDGKDLDVFNKLVKAVAKSLEKANDFSILDLTYFVELGNGAETFPSQSFSEGEKRGRELATQKIENGNQVVLHPQKVGNGVRTIDTWYKNADEAIPVEAYGVVLSQREDRRPLKEGSFFDFFQDGTFQKLVENFDKQKEEDLHYIMSMFIKGGVLGIGASE